MESNGAFDNNDIIGQIDRMDTKSTPSKAMLSTVQSRNKLNYSTINIWQPVH